MFVNQKILDDRRSPFNGGKDSNSLTRSKLRKFLSSRNVTDDNDENQVNIPESNSNKERKKDKIQRKLTHLYSKVTGGVINKNSRVDEYFDNFFYKKFFHFESINAMISLISIAISVTHYELSYGLSDPSEYSVLLYFSTLFSIFLWVNLIFYEMSILEYKKQTRCVMRSESIFSSGQWLNLTKNLIIAFFHPNFIVEDSTFTLHNDWNNKEIERTVNTLLTMGILMRFHFIIRFFVFLSGWMRPDTNSICKKFHFNTNALFSIKSLLQETPLLIYPIVSLCFLFIFTFCIRAFERGVTLASQDYNNYFNALWYVLITMSTVGYGDFSVRTNEARVVAMCACIFGSFLTSLLLLSLTNYFNHTKSEIFMFRLLERVEMLDRNSSKAKKLISAFMNLMSRSGRSGTARNGEDGDASERKFVGSVNQFQESSDKINQAQVINNEISMLGNGISYLQEEYTKVFKNDEKLLKELKGIYDKLKHIYQEDKLVDSN
jgi:hypothetical protein